MKRIPKSIPIFIASSLILGFSMMVSGCSVAMASTAPKKKDLSVLNVGTDRHRVVAELGVPVIAEVVDGKKVDTFSFIQGYSGVSKAGRAIFYGAADVLTVGL